MSDNDVSDDHTRSLGERIRQTAVIYLVWALSIGLALFALLWIRVFFFVDLPLVAFMVDPWVQRAIDRIGTVVLGLAWLSFAVISEAYFRRLYERRNPLIATVKIIGSEVAALVVAYGGHLLMG